MTASPVETPSGKSAGDENFPVGSWLLPRQLRPHVAVFYRFARAIDDIADNPKLAPDDKIARLERFDAALQDPGDDDPALETAHRIRRSLQETRVTNQHCRDLIAAFKQDAVKSRYESWQELIGYCELSANPVGRYLLDLHGEDRAGYGAADGLCSALQVLNHLQDCQEDYHALDRVYLPTVWLAEEGLTVKVLDSNHSPVGFRCVLDRCLNGVDRLLETAAPLPNLLRDTRLATESAMTLRLARRLAVLLRHGDPLAERVALTKLDFAKSGVGALAMTALPRGLRRGSKSRPAAANSEP